MARTTAAFIRSQIEEEINDFSPDDSGAFRQTDQFRILIRNITDTPFLDWN